jgi:hypothetical protein
MGISVLSSELVILLSDISDFNVTQRLGFANGSSNLAISAGLMCWIIVIVGSHKDDICERGALPDC